MAVEARSLAEITAIAACPPARPASSPIHPSLVLYIARVPGSRDVFLTTLKPRQSVVNAQDVEASLYYLHVCNQDEDEDISMTTITSNAASVAVPSFSSESTTLPPYRSSHMIGRKHLPTPPTSPELASVPKFETDPRRLETRASIKRKPLPQRRSTDHSEAGGDRFGKAFRFSHDLSRTTLTLIRRDPGTGAQWNVATLDLPANASKTGDAPINVSITNSAYCRFNKPTKRQPEAYDKADLDTYDNDLVFKRKLETQLFLTADTCRHSHHGGSRGYTFQSPWATKCELSTGTTGRALKCRHQKQSIAGIESTVISELRFDLPALGKRSHVKHSHGNQGSQMSCLASGHRASRTDPVAAIKQWSLKHAPVRELDYSLGQESAGGGLIGRRAKLGKLIVEGEGLQMLDLMVAVNMALWWKAYERTSR